MGLHQAVTIITRPPGYRGQARRAWRLTWPALAAMLGGVLIGVLLSAGVALLVIRPAAPCPRIYMVPRPDLSPDPLDSQWAPMPR